MKNLKVIIAAKAIVLNFVLMQSAFPQQNWIWQNPLPQGNDLAGVYFINTHVGWTVGSNGVILKTTDGGLTWSQQTSGTTNELKEVEFENENIGYVVGRSVILKTTDGGNTWLNQLTGYQGNIACVHFINENIGWAAGDVTVFATTNGGTTWNQYYQGAPFQITDIFFVNETTGYWVGFGGVNKSVDGGKTFNSLYNVPAAWSYTRIQFINQNIGWLKDSDHNIVKTTDGGANWTQLGKIGGFSVGDIFFKNASVGWAAAQDGLWKSSNGGVSWTKVTDLQNLVDVFFCGTSGFAVGSAGHFFSSTNDGTSWLPLYQDFTQGTHLRSIHFNDPETGFLVGEGGAIWRTHDGGNQWIKLNSPPDPETFTAVQFVDTNTGWAVGGLNSRIIMKTQDGGDNWDTKLRDTEFGHGGIDDLFFLNAQRGWTVGNGNVLRTTDGGDNWTHFERPGNSVCFVNPVKGFVVDDFGKLYETDDGGWLWEEKILPTSVNLNKIRFYNEQIGWILGGNGVILKTIDGGVSWQNKNSVTNYNWEYDLLDIAVVDHNRIWALGKWNSFKTTDGGESWTAFRNPSSGLAYGVCFTDANSGWLAGENGSLLKFVDSLPIPAAPTNLSATASQNSIRLTWTDNSDNESGFEIFRSDSTSGQYRKIAQVQANSVAYQDIGLAEVTTYWYRVLASNDLGRSAWCREANAATLFALPATPSLVSPANGAVNQILIPLIEWNPVSGANAYRLQISTAADFSTWVEDSPALIETSKLVGPLQVNTMYYWRISAQNISSSGPWSEIRRFSTLKSAWKTQVSGLSSDLTSVCFVDSYTGWAAGFDGKILKTTDGGITWICQESGSTANLSGISFTDTKTGTAVGSIDDILRTTDGGETWTRQFSGTQLPLLGVFFSDVSTGTIAGAMGNIFRTTDGGASWSKQTSGMTTTFRSVFFSDMNNGTIVGDEGTIIRTTDGGESWVSQSSGTTNPLSGVCFSDRSIGTAVGASGTILRTIDGGANWTIQPTGTWEYLFGVSFTDADTGTVVGSGGIIFHTENGGTTWIRQESGTTNTLRGVCFTDGRTGTAVGDGGVILSMNRGETTPYHEKVNPDVPSGFRIMQNYPNPFNPVTRITFNLPRSAHVRLEIMNIRGELVRILLDDEIIAGEHKFELNAADLPGGLYYYCLKADHIIIGTKKLILLK